MSLALPLGIPIDLIHNTNQKINANINKRAKFVLAYIYIYIYIAHFTSSSDCTFSSFQWHVLCKGQNIAKSQLSKTYPPRCRLSEVVLMGVGFCKLQKCVFFLALALLAQSLTRKCLLLSGKYLLSSGKSL